MDSVWLQWTSDGLGVHQDGLAAVSSSGIQCCFNSGPELAKVKCLRTCQPQLRLAGWCCRLLCCQITSNVRCDRIEFTVNAPNRFVSLKHRAVGLLDGCRNLAAVLCGPGSLAILDPQGSLVLSPCLVASKEPFCDLSGMVLFRG